MKVIEFNISGVKCPLCDLLHNYKVRVEYEENASLMDGEKPFYNFLIKEESSPGGVIKVPVFEVDAYCPKKSTPFRIIIEPKIPVTSVPISINVSVA